MNEIVFRTMFADSVFVPTGRHDSEDDVQLDFSREASENAREILDSVCRKQGITEGKRFSYLTAFIKLISKSDVDAGDLGYTIEEIQCW